VQNVVDVQEIVVGNTMDSIFIVMEFVEHDVKTLLETMTQVCAGVCVGVCVVCVCVVGGVGVDVGEC
jgi:hypothetical protein